MKRSLHIAIGSTCSLPGALKGNLTQITEFATRAAADGADLLLTPELSATGLGNYAEILSTAENPGDGRIFNSLLATAQNSGVIISAGFVEKANENIYVSQYMIWPDGNWMRQRKHRVTRAEHPFKPAVPPLDSDRSDPPQASKISLETFKIKNVLCAITISADAMITGLNDYLKSHSVDLQLIPSGAGVSRHDRVTNADMLTSEGRKKYIALLEGVFFPKHDIAECIAESRAKAAVHLSGYDGRKLYHDGHGYVVNRFGECTALIPGSPNLDRLRPAYVQGVLEI